ncbi:xanthine dehydrogenase family protein molybdopterin-binding subunit [Cognatishimia sp. F0-27]|uniref:xanthine dehydrogenase family protein molybdopterin-binding subunit n=1 Tax=Cognatishimia sp. F0-27 TaxID=2816855 RepID=UPI001D0CAFAB|nr:xanthine dehydrogenase family protein molybdopterin-binding subunit [Cognatishimia sp. F0-27]MCC1494544.1 xanthine dehydrogenase family protein [Cognatishimia sp. F0-27]
MWKIGQSKTRVEDDAHLRGGGDFTLDRVPKDALHMVLVRSSTAAGRLTELDVEGAKAMPGVVDVLTATEQATDGIGSFKPRIIHPGPGGRDMAVPDLYPLATDLIQYVGHPIVAVIAQTRAQAEDAAEAIVVDFDDREPVTDPLAAIAPGAPRVWPDMPDNICFHVEKGDRDAVDDGFKQAAHVTRARLRINRVTAAALEPRAAIARHDGTGYRLDAGTQTPHRIAKDLGPVLGVDPATIRVVAGDTGGSFGMKNAAYPEYALALWAARRTGQAVVWSATRTESFLSDAHGRDQYADAAIALDKDGRILALDVQITAGIGACLGPATTHPPVANVAGLGGVYTTPAIHVTISGVFTNCQQVAPYRGAGRPEATYIIERMLDLAALDVGMDRVDLRRLNMITRDALPYDNPLGWRYDSGEFEAILDRTLLAADWNGFPARRSASEATGKLRGIGIANPIEIAGGPVSKPHPEYAALTVATQGNGRIVLGSCNAGQGHPTAFRQLVHDRLGLDPEAIDFVNGDTGTVPDGTGTFGSRSLTAAGTALWQAMSDAIETARPTAAKMLNCAPDDVTFADTRFRAPDGQTVTFLEAVSASGSAIEIEVKASATGATFPNGCHICEIEIDPDTGAVSVERYTVVDDVGIETNPLLVKGQVAGGVAQGIGQALMENIAYDPDSGQVLSASFMDYAMPRATDLPGAHILSHPVPTLNNPLGAKGVGEAGTVGAVAASINAVCDALSTRGISHLDMPASPARVWQALQGFDT